VLAVIYLYRLFQNVQACNWDAIKAAFWATLDPDAWENTDQDTEID